MKRNIQRAFVPLLLMVIVGMYLFTLWYEEPYPAIYQPSFAATVSNLDTIAVSYATITAIGRNGQTHDLDYKKLFSFSFKNWGVNIFNSLLKAESTRTFAAAPSEGWYDQLKYTVFINHPVRWQQKRKVTFDDLKQYIKTRAETLTGTDIESIIFRLYKSHYIIPTEVRNDELVDEIIMEL